MGKSIIVKGADFSVNRIGSVQVTEHEYLVLGKTVQDNMLASGLITGDWNRNRVFGIVPPTVDGYAGKNVKGISLVGTGNVTLTLWMLKVSTSNSGSSYSWEITKKLQTVDVTPTNGEWEDFDFDSPIPIAAGEMLAVSSATGVLKYVPSASNADGVYAPKEMLNTGVDVDDNAVGKTGTTSCSYTLFCDIYA